MVIPADFYQPTRQQLPLCVFVGSLRLLLRQQCWQVTCRFRLTTVKKNKNKIKNRTVGPIIIFKLQCWYCLVSIKVHTVNRSWHLYAQFARQQAKNNSLLFSYLFTDTMTWWKNSTLIWSRHKVMSVKGHIRFFVTVIDHDKEKFSCFFS